MRINFDQISIAIICIGLGIILMFEDVNLFPWILLILGIAFLPKIFFRDNKHKYIQQVLWLCGLAALFIYGIFWPGILILAGLSIIIDGFKPRMRQHKYQDKTKKQKTEYQTYD